MVPALLQAAGWQLAGYGICLVSAVMWAAYTIEARRAGVDALHATAIIMVISAALFIPIYLLLPGQRLWEASATEFWVQLIYQGPLTGIVALLVYTRAVAILGATRASSFTALLPLSAMLLAIPVVGEWPTLRIAAAPFWPRRASCWRLLSRGAKAPELGVAGPGVPGYSLPHERRGHPHLRPGARHLGLSGAAARPLLAASGRARRPAEGPKHWPEVVAIVPARNEAPVVGEAVRSLLRQDYPGKLRIILVDDQSSDGTADIVRRTAEELGAADRVRVISGKPLPEGWTGKMWAVHQGSAEIEDFSAGAKYVWLTDADIAHDADSLRGLVARAEAGNLALTSLMARLKTDTFAERALIPAYVYFFQMLYPFAWVNRSEEKDGGRGRRLHAGAAQGAEGGGWHRGDQERADRRLRAGQGAEEAWADLARPRRRRALAARLSQRGATSGA